MTSALRPMHPSGKSNPVWGSIQSSSITFSYDSDLFDLF